MPYLYSATQHGGHFISYDDAESLGYKLDYIDQHQLGGVMYWEVTADRGGELLELISDRMQVQPAP